MKKSRDAKSRGIEIAFLFFVESAMSNHIENTL